MDASGSELHPVEQLADEFMDRQRRGERPTLEEYTHRYPALADEIREVFPALVMIDQIAPADDDLRHSDKTLETPDQILPKQIGDYRILREIGRGGMGVVYEAEQESLRRRVALKILPRDIAASARSMERFQREARAAARMHHTNIVPVFEVGQEGVTAYYAMQLIQGQGIDLVIDDLKRLRSEHSSSSRDKRRPPSDAARSIAASLMSGRFQQENLAAERESRAADAPPRPIVSSNQRPDLAPAVTETVSHSAGSTVTAALPGQSEISTAETNRNRFHRSVAQIGIQTADALAYSHARGIIHRDIKPSNLILDAGGVVWITDFGLAKTCDDAMTHTGDILGTLRYMSPERFRGQCDVRADIYSLGLTLYEVMVLKPAFESPDRLKLIEMVRQSEPPTPRSIDPRIPRDLETIVLKSIDKDVKRRYQSADELSEDLRHFVDDEPIKARRISLPERLIRWSRRNKAVAASLTAIALLLITASVGSSIAATVFRRNEKAQRESARRNLQLANEKDVERAKAVEARQNEAKAAEAYRQQLYRSDMAAAMEAIRRGEWERVETLLRRHMPAPDQVDLRRFEWFVHFQRWKLASDVPRLEVGTQVHSLCSLDSNRLLVGHARGLTVFQAATRERRVLFESQTKREYSYVAVSPQDSNIVVSADMFVRMHRVDDGFLLMEEKSGDAQVYGFSFSPDGKRLAAAVREHGQGDSWMDIWDLQTRQKVNDPIKKDGHAFLDACFSPDGKLIATAATDGHSITIWDAVQAEEVKEMPAFGPVRCVRFSPDGSYLLAGSLNGFIRVWRTSDYRLVQEVKAHERRVYSIAFSPNGQLLASGSYDSSVKLWQLSSAGRIGLVDEFYGGAYPVCFLDDSRLASGSNLSDGRVMIWNIKNNPDRHILRGHSGIVRAVGISPDNRLVASGGQDYQLRIWDLQDDTCDVLAGHTGTIRDLAFSPQGKLIATGGWDGQVILWDVDHRKRLCVLPHSLPVWHVWFSKQGDFVVGEGRNVPAQEKQIEVWRTDTGEVVPLEQVSERELARPRVGEFPEPFDTIAQGGGTVILLLDPRTGKERARLSGHEHTIWDHAVSRDGRMVVSASEDQTVRVWCAATADEVESVGWYPNQPLANPKRSIPRY